MRAKEHSDKKLRRRAALGEQPAVSAEEATRPKMTASNLQRLMRQETVFVPSPVQLG